MLNFSSIDSLLTSKPAKVAAAISGGADSMCLAHLLYDWCAHHKVELTALVVDHGLRTESAAEALWVQTFLMGQGIKTIILPWEGSKPKAGIQNKARTARYNLLEAYCKEHEIKHLFVGHTLNDQAETVLMRVIRGSGINGIAGIKEKSRYGATILLRPLLNTTRNAIESHLNAIGWAWVNDPSNLNHKYDRIKVRSLLASYTEEFGDELIYKRLSLLGNNARRAKDYIEGELNIIWSNYVKLDPLNFIVVDNAIYGLHEELKLRLFVRIFKYLRPTLPTPRLSSLLALFKLPKPTQTLSGCLIIKDPRRTLFVLEVGKHPKDLSLEIGVDNIWCNLKVVVGAPGLVARALGREGWRHLKSLDYVKPDATPLSVIHSLLAIYEGDKLICVPHLNFKDTNIEIDISKL